MFLVENSLPSPLKLSIKLSEITDIVHYSSWWNPSLHLGLDIRYLSMALQSFVGPWPLPTHRTTQI
jgi:hypothetical protein